MQSASWFTPGYKQVRGTAKAIQSFQDAELWDGFMYLTGANPEWNQPGLSRFYKNIEPEAGNIVEEASGWWDALKPQD
jgi:hypothetical protein